MTSESYYSGYYERLYQGERCIVQGGARTRTRAEWKAYRSVSVTFLNDDGTVRRIAMVPAGRFNTDQTCTGRRLRVVNGTWTETR